MLLSRFFGKSKPIVFLSLVVYISIHFWVKVWQTNSTSGFAVAGKYILLLLLFFGVNFIVKRNKISQQNAYSTLFFSLLCTAIPRFFIDFNYLIPAFFVVLGLRRIISLKTQIDTKKKIFDASLWFFVASLFQPYLSLLIVLAFLGVLQYTLYSPRNLFIPIVAWVCGGLFFTAFQLWQTDEWIFFYETYTQFGWNNFSAIWQNHQLTFSILIPLILFVFLAVSKVISKAQLALKASLILLVLAFVFVFLGWMFSSQNHAAGLGIAFIPLSMIASTSLEIRIKPIIQEIVIILLFLASLIGVFMPI